MPNIVQAIPFLRPFALLRDLSQQTFRPFLVMEIHSEIGV